MTSYQLPLSWRAERNRRSAMSGPTRFHHSLTRWRIVARATFEWIPDYSERVFIMGDNVSLAVCCPLGHGYVRFHRPLSSPMLRAYIKDALAPVHLSEISQYGTAFTTCERRFKGSQTEEFIFEGQIAP